jgi:energy-coupling factor transporter ATP-binding protein EcfA2
MPSLEALQNRLEEFRAVGKNLQLDPLVTQQELARLGVPYQEALVDALEQAIEDGEPDDNKLIFTGHRGCGKSTLLAELGFRLLETRRYFVVNFSIADTIERSAVDHVNVLFSMALQLLEAAERRSIKLKPGLKLDLYRWLGKHTKTESKAVEAAIETSGEAGVKGGIPALLEFLAKIKGSLKINSVIRDEISIEFARNLSDLVDRINQIQTYIENATREQGEPQQVLVIIDDLDKLDLSVTETIFSKNIKSLLAPNCQIVYTLPIATLREVSVRRSIVDNVKKIHTMRVTKFFSKATVNQADRVPDAEMVGVFEQILDRRLPQNLVEPAVRRQMILKSGGVVRELIRIADLCRDECMQTLRRQIRKAQFAEAIVTIDQAVLDRVLIDLQVSFSEPLGQVDYELLKFIYEKFEPQDAENQRFLNLLHALYMLEYRNAEQWYGLNPIVMDLLVQKGVIHVSS